MKNSKVKIVSSIGVAVLGLASFSSVASAQQAKTLELADLLNTDVDQVTQVNTAVQNPLNPIFAEMAKGMNLANGDTPEETQAQIDALTKILAKNNLAIATKTTNKTDSSGYSYPTTETYMAFHISADDLDKIGCTVHCASGTEKIGGVLVYAPDGDDGYQFMTYLGDLLISTPNRADMNTIINNYNTLATANTLSKSANYQAIEAKNLPSSFINVYVNPANYQTTTTEMSSTMSEVGLGGLMNIEKDLMGAINGEGFSVAQSTTGFNFNVFVQGDDAKLKTLNLSLDRYNFVPELYKYINSSNLLVFGEENNLKGKIQDVMKLMTMDAESTKGFNDWKASLKTNANVDFDQELLPLLSGKYALAIHQSNQIWPAITIVLDVRNMEQSASAVLSKLVNYADKSILAAEKVSGENYYSKTVGSLDGAAYYQMTFDPTKSADTSTELKNLGSDKVVLKVSAVLTSQGFLLITTSPNVNDVFAMDGKGMLNNATFSQNYTNPTQSISGLSYVNLDNIKSYADMLMTTFSAPADAKTFVDELLKPWHDIFALSQATSNTAWAKGTVNVDAAGLATYGDLFTKYFSSIDDNYDYGEGQNLPPNSTDNAKNFCDVHASDWFAPYVDELSSNETISGYADGCFKPNNPITRAEFIKMVLVGDNFSTTPYEKITKTFKDVPAQGSEWYDQYVYAAVEQKLINGYADGTFRPNALITRAEAVQILFNATYELSDVSTVANFTQFSDVRNGDWFSNPIHAAFVKGLVKGTTADKFEPNRNLTRAEAAKIIKLLHDMDFGYEDNFVQGVGPTEPAQQPGMLRPIDYTQQETQTTGPNIY